jgi:signal transduction histidine kinase
MKPFDRRTASAWTWLLLCGALAAAGLWLVLFLSRSLARERDVVESQSFMIGRLAAARAAHLSLSPTSGPLSRRILPGTPPKDAAVFPAGAALLLGKRVVWGDPGFSPDAIGAPAPGSDAVFFQGSHPRYVRTFEDGRTLVVAFRAPAFAALRGRYVAALAVDLMALAALLGLMTWFSSRLYGAYRGMEESLREAGSLLSSEAASPTEGAALRVFQKTLEELRARTAELEALHARERRRLEEVEGLAETLSANLDAGFLRFDEEGRLTGLNASARSLLGITEIPRLGDSEAVLLASRPAVREVLDEARTTRAIALREEVEGAPGRVLQAAGIPLFNLLHQRKGHLLLLKDQTGVASLRRALRETESLSRLGEVAAGVAHEVRNSLGALLAHLRLLEADHPGLGEDDHFRALREEAARVEQVVRNLLEFARPLPLARESVALRDLLSQEAALLRESSPGLDVEVECPEDLVAEADFDALSRAVRNLARNAAEAAASAGRTGSVRLRALEAAAETLLEVEDDGPGLAAGSEESVFTPFSSQKPGGTGLGLSIARKIAREHGGDLACFPSELGGAGFRLTLPRARSEREQ